MPYAVNVSDLVVRRDPITLPCLVAPVTPNRIFVDATPRDIAGTAVLLECDEERAAAIIEVIRIKYPPDPKGRTNPWMRCYYSKTGKGGWKRV